MTFSITVKIQDGSQNAEKSKFFRGPRGVVLSILRVQTLPKIGLSRTVFEIIFLPKFKMGGVPNLEKFQFFRGPRGVVVSVQRVQNFTESLSLSKTSKTGTIL